MTLRIEGAGAPELDRERVILVDHRDVAVGTAGKLAAHRAGLRGVRQDGSELVLGALPRPTMGYRGYVEAQRAFGGFDGGVATNVVESYAPASDSWQFAAALPPAAMKRARSSR